MTPRPHYNAKTGTRRRMRRSYENIGGIVHLRCNRCLAYKPLEQMTTYYNTKKGERIPATCCLLCKRRQARLRNGHHPDDGDNSPDRVYSQRVTAEIDGTHHIQCRHCTTLKPATEMLPTYTTGGRPQHTTVCKACKAAYWAKQYRRKKLRLANNDRDGR